VKVASLIGASSKEVVFTSGATESNNLAIKGVAEFYKARRNHVITVVTEHKCVLDSCRHLEHQERGTNDKTPAFDVTYLPVEKSVTEKEKTKYTENEFDVLLFCKFGDLCICF
jgi:cysteine desulfurase